MPAAWTGGSQSLKVELWTESQLVDRATAPPLSAADRAGGPGLSGVLNNAFLGPEPPELPLLGFLDPFDNTVFNRHQVLALLPELERLYAWATEADEVQALDGVTGLARRCASSSGLVYLVFIGD
jgi:hypothetical protein